MLQTIKDGEWVSSWYQQRLREFGVDPRGVGYNQRSSQQKRFELLSQLGGFDGRRVLDVGCGFGDFFQFLLEKEIQPDYTGLDLVPDMVAKCNERFKSHLGPHCRFESGDTLQYRPATKFDYVVACGIFGLRSENAKERIVPTLQRFFSWCTAGVAVNFLSQRADRHDPKCLYVDPAEILTHALVMTPSVKVVHNYLPNDFTLYMYRTPAWEQK